MVEKRERRRTTTGVVERAPKDKTISVATVQLVQHTRYRRYVRRRTVYKVHDEKQEAKRGDVVEIMETRPLSKTKHWRLVRVVARRGQGQRGSEERA